MVAERVGVVVLDSVAVVVVEGLDDKDGVVVFVVVAVNVGPALVVGVGVAVLVPVVVVVGVAVLVPVVVVVGKAVVVPVVVVEGVAVLVPVLVVVGDTVLVVVVESVTVGSSVGVGVGEVTELETLIVTEVGAEFSFPSKATYEKTASPDIPSGSKLKLPSALKVRSPKDGTETSAAVSASAESGSVSLARTPEIGNTTRGMLGAVEYESGLVTGSWLA